MEVNISSWNISFISILNEYYWRIEYDVVFTGNGNVLFSAFKNSDADLLSSHIEMYEDGVRRYTT